MHRDAILKHNDRTFVDQSLLSLARLIGLQLPRMKHEYITDTMLNTEFGSLIVYDG
jgi:hypothetical protein